MRSEQTPDDLRVKRRASRGDAGQRVEEVVDVEHAVLEQVAEAAAGHQLDRVASLDVLREQQDAEVRVGRSQAACYLCAIVGVIRRHADVDDRHVGLGLVDGGFKRVGVGGPGDDLVAGIVEQAGASLPTQRPALSDHDPHGTTASTVVPCPSLLASASAPPSALTRSPRPASPDPADTVAPPLPSSTIRTSTRPSQRAMRTSIRVASACLTAFAIASLVT